ncbi:hypothetical protein [Archangium lansingense]|uniref:Uncharacterized protein n=1 Tax=Archangium lansingense TaxID=2995310 RepID=A0ABT4AC14_9BACT|nr:hypothetical protein [Archangium lansinium]MCY1079121.1 hypothetical protein [Archangium lansinium]
MRVDGIRMESERYTLGRWVFGDVLVWSSNSRWFAAQHWDRLERVLQTSILVLDLELRAWKIVGPNDRAIMRPTRIDDEDMLEFESHDVRTGEVRSGRVYLLMAMSRWGTLDETDGLS